MASLKTLAREMKKAAVKVPKSVKNLGVNVSKQGYCGRHSEIREDIDWTKIPRGWFDRTQRDRGDNRGITQAMIMSKKVR